MKRGSVRRRHLTAAARRQLLGRAAVCLRKLIPLLGDTPGGEPSLEDGLKGGAGATVVKDCGGALSGALAVNCAPSYSLHRFSMPAAAGHLSIGARSCVAPPARVFPSAPARGPALRLLMPPVYARHGAGGRFLALRCSVVPPGLRNAPQGFAVRTFRPPSGFASRAPWDPVAPAPSWCNLPAATGRGLRAQWRTPAFIMRPLSCVQGYIPAPASQLR